MTMTSQNKRHIAALRRNFEKIDRDKDGEISMEDWITALEKSKFDFTRYIEHTIQHIIIRFDFREDVVAMFKEKDKDHNGKLSWEEFCGEKTPTEKAFGVMDVDNNGKVSKEVTRTIT